jgi:hypothetical protein
MGRVPWATYLWPGLPQLWRDGSWSSLAATVGVAAAVNLLLALTLLWSELLAPGIRIAAWGALAVIWVAAAIYAYGWDRQPARTAPESGLDLFSEAMDHYLKGNWFETEHLIGRVLRSNPRDVEARLLLATLLRHTGRREEAAAELHRLEALEGSQEWNLEISRERELLEAAGRPAEQADEAPDDLGDQPALRSAA